MSKRNILLCVAGMTPQIITETLYAVTQEQGQQIDEIRVITTLGGRNRLHSALLDPEHGQFFAFCRDYGLDPAAIKFDETTIALLRTPDGLTLNDIRTPQENEYAGDQICDIVRALCQDPATRLHASAAGGRKTMSIYLTAAMQLFGRADDTLSHVLVGLTEDAPADVRVEDFEMNPSFYYPPPEPRQLDVKDRHGKVVKQVATQHARIYLAEIPFIRLRGIGAETRRETGGTRLYGQMVKQAQDDLDFFEAEYDLQVNLREYTLKMGRYIIELTPRELFLYVMFADFRRRGRNSVRLKELTEADFHRTFRLIALAHGEAVGWDEVSSFPGFDKDSWAENMLAQVTSDLPKNHEDFKKSFQESAARIRQELRRKKFHPDCGLNLQGPKGSACYGISLAAQRLKFVR